MTNPVLEENVERLLRRCVPRIPAEQVERSLARAERRRAAPARHPALPVAVAAAATFAIAAWLALSSRPGPNPPAPVPGAVQGQAQPQEIEKLIGELAAESRPVRQAAERRLREIGRPALEPLDKALYHENPDVRIPARDLARLIRKDFEAQAESAKAKAAAAPVHAAVKKVRDRWLARDLKNIEDVVREAFQPARVNAVRYVPKKQIAREFRLGKEKEEDTSDALTAEMAEALDGKEGLAFIDPASEEVLPYAPTLLFTLPDKQGWSAYVYVKLAGAAFAAENFRTRLLAMAENRQVWGVDPEEMPDLPAYVERLLSEGVEISDDPAGLKIKAVKPSSLGAARGLLAGDVVRDINGSPVKSVQDAKAAVTNAGGVSPTGLRIVLDRTGKPMVLEYRPLPR